MQIQNETSFEAFALPGFDPEGREVVSVIAKGTFRLRPGRPVECVEAEQRVPICLADEYWGEPGESPVKLESDLSPFKPATDLILLGCAYDPRGRATKRQNVGFSVGGYAKQATVTSEEPEERIPLHRLEEIRRKGPRWTRPRRPKDGFGFYPKQCKPRLAFAGTYDESWKKERAPFLPADFDYRFFQSAFPGLVCSGHLRGDEPVRARNVSPDGPISTSLPGGRVEVEAFLATGEQRRSAALDTVVLEPEARRVSLVWRALFETGCSPADVHGFILKSPGLAA